MTAPRSRRAPHRADRGAGTVLAAVVAVMIAMTCLLGVAIMGWIGCARRAAAVADLAALAGARSVIEGRGGCTAAAVVAARNGGRVTTCTVDGDSSRFVLRLSVEVDLRPRVRGPGMPLVVTGSAVAGPVGS